MATLRVGRTLFLTVAVLVLGSTTASASVIELFQAVVGGGTATPLISTPSRDNDNTSVGSANTVVISPKVFEGLAPIDIVFRVVDSSGFTEYFFNELVINSTGTAWTGYRIELGFGTGGGFVQSSLPDFLDFDAPDNQPTPTASAFSTLGHGANQIDWSDGTLADGSSMTLTFSIDIPNSAQCENTTPACPVFGEAGQTLGFFFTLRQIPLFEPGDGGAGPIETPMPATAGLVTLGLLAAGALGGMRLRR
jgi:hypothetical protein